MTRSICSTFLVSLVCATIGCAYDTGIASPVYPSFVSPYGSARPRLSDVTYGTARVYFKVRMSILENGEMASKRKKGVTDALTVVMPTVETGTRVGLSRSRRWRRPAASSLGLSMLSAAGLVDPIVSAHEAFVALSAGALAAHTGASQVTAWPAVLLGEEAGVGYSKFSYYTTLGLYVLSFPGLWSVVKRATKTKYKDANYVVPGPGSTEEGAESAKQTAAKIIAYFQANNYKILEAGQEITFEGAIQANKGQAFFLVFCTALSFATLALVLQIQFPAVGNYWFLLTLLSPYAGIYYWQNASRKDRAKVRLETTDDDLTTELFITAAEEELDRLSKTMGFMEKGKIRVKGLLEVEPSGAPLASGASAVAAVAEVKEEPTPQEVET